MAKRSLIPRGGNDLVMTPRPLAKVIIDHFHPEGAILDPCRGDGAFYDQYPAGCVRDWCEVREGRDFLKNWPAPWEHYEWVITNPPWSLFRPFLRRSMEVADNVVFLCTVNHFWLKARLRDIGEASFGFREILLVPTPPKPWPQSGFQLGAVHLQRGWDGPTKVSPL